MKNERYPEGYRPKLDYYRDQAMQAMQAGNQQHVEYFMGKLTYFMKRQAAWLHQQQMISKFNELYK